MALEPDHPWGDESELVARLIGTGLAPTDEKAETAIAALRAKLTDLGVLEKQTARLIYMAIQDGMTRRSFPPLDIEGTRGRSVEKLRQEQIVAWGGVKAFNPSLSKRPRNPTAPKKPKQRPGPAPKPKPEPAVAVKVRKLSPQQKPKFSLNEADGRMYPTAEVEAMLTQETRAPKIEGFEFAEQKVGAHLVDATWLRGPDEDGDGLMVGVFRVTDEDDNEGYAVWRVKTSGGGALVLEEKLGEAKSRELALDGIYTPLVAEFISAP